MVKFLNNARTVWTTKISMITRLGRGVFLGVSDAPTARGRGPWAPQLWGSLLFMHTPLDAEQ